MRRPRERGVALVATVTALASLAVIASGVAWSAGRARLATHRALRVLQADALLRSGLATATVLLEEQAALGEPDTLRSPWAAPVGPLPVGAGQVTVAVEDEARRLDLGTPALVQAFPRLLERLDLDPALADALADWTDADDVPRPHGAERAWYLARTPPLLPPDRPLRALGELTAVRGFDARTLARLAPHVTATGDGRVNPNTASPEVLEAWLGDASRARAMLALRAEAPVACDDLPACTTRGQRYAVRITAEVDEVRRSGRAVVWVAAGSGSVLAWRRDG